MKQKQEDRSKFDERIAKQLTKLAEENIKLKQQIKEAMDYYKKEERSVIGLNKELERLKNKTIKEWELEEIKKLKKELKETKSMLNGYKNLIVNPLRQQLEDSEEKFDRLFKHKENLVKEYKKELKDSISQKEVEKLIDKMIKRDFGKGKGQEANEKAYAINTLEELKQRLKELK